MKVKKQKQKLPFFSYLKIDLQNNCDLQKIVTFQEWYRNIDFLKKYAYSLPFSFESVLPWNFLVHAYFFNVIINSALFHSQK